MKTQTLLVTSAWMVLKVFRHVRQVPRSHELTNICCCFFSKRRQLQISSCALRVDIKLFISLLVVLFSSVLMVQHYPRFLRCVYYGYHHRLETENEIALFIIVSSIMVSYISNQFSLLDYGSIQYWRMMFGWSIIFCWTHCNLSSKDCIYSSRLEQRFSSVLYLNISSLSQKLKQV